MLVLSSSLLLASAAISPGLGRLESLESLAVQHFGKANAAPFLHMNRKLQDLGGDEGSGNNGDITEMCDNEQFGTFCAMSDDELASSMSNMAMSANNGAASGVGARFLTAESDAQLCALKSMKSFYCGSLCDTTCKSFLSSGGDGQALTASSSNDESNVESNDAPSFMSNESELNKVCSSSCLMDLLKSMTGMMESLSKCGGEGLSALSSNDGAASNPGLPSDPTAEIEQQLGRICVKNDQNKYCMSEFLAFGKKHDKPPTGKPTCESQVVKDLLGMGCCFGSILAQSATIAPQGDQQDMSEIAYWISKCGGSTLPCSEGAVKALSLVSSSVSISADGLTLAKLEEPAFINAIKKGIATVIKQPASAVLLDKITIADSRVRGRRLGASTATVHYSVMASATDAAAIQTSITSVSDSSLTDTLKADAAFKNIPDLSAQQSKEVSEKKVEASPAGNGGIAAIPALTAMLMAIALAGTLI